MKIPAGRKDTEITFQAQTAAQESSYGTRGKTWANVSPTEWAEVQDVLPSRSESIDNSIDMTRRPCRIRCNYRSDVTPQHRVKIGSRVLEIVSGPVVLGSPARPDGIEMVCVEYSTLGDTP